jgi:hypothetical protein
MFIAMLFTMDKLWKQPRCHYWWMDQENVVFVHNGILLSHKEEWNLIICK